MIPIPLIAAMAGAGLGAISNKEDRLGGALKGALMGGTMGVSPALGASQLFGKLLGDQQNNQGIGPYGQGGFYTPYQPVPHQTPGPDNTMDNYLFDQLHGKGKARPL